MEIIEQRKASILDMSRGAINEEVNAQLEKLAENLLDPNTDPLKSRSLTVTLEFKGDDAREIFQVKATTTTKLAPSKSIPTQVAFGRDENGNMCAVELSRIQPGQMTLDGGTEPDPLRIIIGNRNKETKNA